jgi:hypothetical protein
LISKLKEYTGHRDPRFVAVHRGGLLDVAHHRLLAGWAADCAEHVLYLFTDRCPQDDRPRRALEVARAWSRGEATAGEARQAAIAAHAAARSAADPVAKAVARAAAHAAATAHMADHELRAAAYAVRAKCLASLQIESALAGEREQTWQREHMDEIDNALKE